MTQQQTALKAVVHAQEEGGYWAEIPNLPGCFTRGDSLDEVREHLVEAITCHLGIGADHIRVSWLEITG
jgi:predicted RNase H-like HicB family nuclease